MRRPAWNRLQEVDLFEGLKAGELAAIDRLFTEIVLPAGTDLIGQGRFGQEFFVIADGAVTVSRNGREVARLTRGDFVGEVALVGNGRRNASVRAQSDVRVLVQNRREFASLLEAVPSVRDKVLAAAERRAA